VGLDRGGGRGEVAKPSARSGWGEGGKEVHRWLNPLLLLDLRLKMLALSKKPTILFYFAFYKFNTEAVR
jgi:hypothetical protein